MLTTLDGYTTPAGFHDEAVSPDGRLRPAVCAALEAIGRHDLGELCTSVAEALERQGVTFSSIDGDATFNLCPVPRVIEAGEWAGLEAGIAQRVAALNAFLADAYGEQAIVAAGVIPARAIETCPHFERSLRGRAAPGGIWVGIAGLDLVRDASGRFLVLEDNLTTPSGVAYAVAARESLREMLGDVVDSIRPLDGLADMLRDTLRAAAPSTAAGDPRLLVLTDGPDNAAYWEHAELARMIGAPLATPDDLEVREGVLWLSDHDARIDVVYRRTNEARAGSDVGRLLLEPWRRGTLGVVNAFGTMVADDKLLHAYVEEMISFYLGEEPLLPSVPTYDLSRPEVLAEHRDRLGELVVKPRIGYGGIGVMIGPHAEADEIARVGESIDERPGDFVAQEPIALSCQPTAIDGRLEPRHVDLRPFAFNLGDRVAVLPGGLTRVALDEGALVVNSSQNGGVKDTWILRS